MVLAYIYDLIKAMLYFKVAMDFPYLSMASVLLIGTGLLVGCGYMPVGGKGTNVWIEQSTFVVLTNVLHKFP